MKKKTKNKSMLGPVITILILTFIVIISSSIFSLLQIDAEQTKIVNGVLETSVVTVNNLLTKEGLTYMFSSIVQNLQVFKPLVLLIISLISISIAEASGLFKIIFRPLNVLNSKFLTFLVLVITIISTFIGEYSYIFLLPVVAILYQTIGKKPLLGILTVFIGITIGYGSGLIYNSDEIALSYLTQMAAKVDVDKNFTYALTSNLYISIISTFIISIVGTFIIHNFLDKKLPKSATPEEDELIISKKALYYSNITLVFVLSIIIYMIIPGLPGSGALLSVDGTYIERLIGENSPFYQGFAFIVLITTMICSFVYGHISGNIKNSNDYSVGLSKNFENLGYLFVLLFFISQMLGILEWTNLGKVLACLITSTLSYLPFTGIILLLSFFVGVIIITILIPSAKAKWDIMSPIMVPLMMKSNIAPSFTQFIFRIADGIGKSITPFFSYYMITLAFLEKYNTKDNVKITVFGTLKIIFPTVLLFGGLWLLILIAWYVIGLPTGPNIYPAL